LSTPWAPSNKVPQFNLGNISKSAIGAAALVILVLLILFSTYFTIDQGERGVILHNGAIVGEAEPGLHFKMPIITSIAKSPFPETPRPTRGCRHIPVTSNLQQLRCR